MLTLMQLGSIKKEFRLREIGTIDHGPIYKNLDGITGNFCINTFD
jgi:hypothetical protein